MLNQVSIIIPVLNAQNTIEKAVISVLNQSYPYKELIVIDGGSTDNTLALLDAYKTQIACLISEKDKGIYEAINKGIKHASGNWIYILGADDQLHNENVLQTIFCHELKNLDIVFGNVNNLGAKHALIRKTHVCKFNFQIIWRNTLHQQGVFYNKKRLNINFNTRYKILADYDFHLKLYLQQANAQYYNLTISDCMADGISKKFNKQLYLEEYKIKKENLNVLLYLLNVPWIILKYLMKKI